jgi:hypothetical protein
MEGRRVLAKVVSARRAGELLGLPHREVIRRIRKGDIKAQKLGWSWIVELDAIEEAKTSEWYARSTIRIEVDDSAAVS